jgi:hypothetical protein
MVGEDVTAEEVDAAIAGCLIDPASLWSENSSIFGKRVPYGLTQQFILLYKRPGHDVAFVDPHVVELLRDSGNTTEDVDFRVIFQHIQETPVAKPPVYVEQD